VDDYRAASLQSWSSVAPDWAKLTDRIDRQLSAAADWMIDALALAPSERVLELAGGPGTLSMMAARAVGPRGHVMYSDFAEPMVAAARDRLTADGARGVEYRVIDAEAIDIADGSVDAVACRMGYMLMADPAAALRETARVLAPGGRVALAVWADAASNPWAALPMQAVASQLGAPPPPADAPGLWALAEPARLKGALEAAGFESIRIEALDDMVEFESAEQWIEMTRRLAGPLRALLANLDDDTRGAIEDRVREAAKPYELPDGRVSMPERILAASART
jgi:SAM-dependent methyltransferase